MQVEVNEHTIIKYGLVQLTGNSVEVLLTRAKEAADAGYILTVQIPDTPEVRMNMFDVGQGEPVDEATLKQQDSTQNPIVGNQDRFTARETTGRRIEVTFEGISELPDDDAVDGEIVEED